MAPSRVCACKLYMTLSSFNQILKGRFCATESMERVLQHLGLYIYLERKGNSPFPSLPPLQSESKCEVFVMVISSTLHMNENYFFS